MLAENGSPQHSRHTDSLLFRILVYSSFSVPAIIGIISVLSWAFNDISLISISTGYVPIVPSTSLSIILLSFGLFGCSKKSLHRLTRVMSVASVIIALLINLWIIAPLSPDPEDLFDPLNTYVNGYYIEHASPITLIATISCCIVVLLLLFNLHTRSKMAEKTLTIIALVLLSIGVLTSTGYLYGNPLLYGAPIKPVALLAGVSFLFFGLGAILLKGSDSWPLRVFIGPSVRARLLRVFLPVTIFVIIIEGLVMIALMPDSANPNHVIITSTIAFITALLMGFLISRISNQLGTNIDRTNELLVKTSRELQQANERLKVLDTITRHDSINQLTILMGRIGMLKEVIGDKDLKQQMDEPIKAAKSIEEILMFARDYQTIGNEEPSWVDVRQTFDNAVRIVRVPQTVAVNADVGSLKIFADKMFEKVFLNLIDNSMRYGEHVKNISISYHKQWDGGLRIIYRDDGVGISSEDKKLLFQRGFGKHTGLGMFLSKEILGYTGMTISEKGEPGKGALFEIAVPEGKFRI